MHVCSRVDIALLPLETTCHPIPAIIGHLGAGACIRWNGSKYTTVYASCNGGLAAIDKLHGSLSSCHDVIHVVATLFVHACMAIGFCCAVWVAGVSV
jgi:hypothetical protein